MFFCHFGFENVSHTTYTKDIKFSMLHIGYINIQTHTQTLILINVYIGIYDRI